ncbi:ion transporter [Halorubellus sp. JP-L1]|uniref:pentapeptide repeat-containing protein n=1 Tax=Halorubellus sp. JP-L1 TaxID=2715753 RepID=UPI001408A121|nr:pentapeptide repeat-containing protein [Halorubellus sp. JP-L1]NHN42658.1 ion transporter [Halorubellus sp. JP-L1]
MDAPRTRCGYEYDVSAVSGPGAASCWRPVWADHERCIWHANATDKTPAAFAEAHPVRGERLDGAILRGVSLPDVRWFADCSLVGADFTDAALPGACFDDADLRRADFRDADLHGATFVDANVEDALFVYADVRDAAFEGARLYRAVLSDARVNEGTEFGRTVVYETDAERDASPGGFERNTESAVWTYREIQRVFEDNANHSRLLEYFLREMDLRRRAAWRARDVLSVLRLEGSRLVMRYGISPWRLVATSVVVIVGSAMVFPLTGGLVETGDGRPITYTVSDPTSAPPTWMVFVFLKSLYFSAITFATLGYGDVQPIGSITRAVAAMESLAGSVLLALLVFVLTSRIR